MPFSMSKEGLTTTCDKPFGKVHFTERFLSKSGAKTIDLDKNQELNMRSELSEQVTCREFAMHN